jgi:hypothetical protein
MAHLRNFSGERPHFSAKMAENREKTVPRWLMEREEMDAEPAQNAFVVPAQAGTHWRCLKYPR